MSTPAVTHTISVRRVHAWLGSAGKSPREQVLKARLRAALAGTTALPSP